MATQASDDKNGVFRDITKIAPYIPPCEHPKERVITSDVTDDANCMSIFDICTTCSRTWVLSTRYEAKRSTR